MRKIYTLKRCDEVWDHFWEGKSPDDEMSTFEERSICQYFFNYLPRDAEILDAGCGMGAWVAYLKDRGFRVFGLDNNKSAIDVACRFRPDIRIDEGSVSSLPYADSSLGACISLGVLEHFEGGCEQELSEMFRVLMPGGLLFFTVPMDNLFRKLFAHPLRSIYLWLKKLAGNEVIFTEYRYTKKEVEAMLSSAGFEIVTAHWDDFLPKNKSLGIWADFPQFHAPSSYGLKFLGRLAAITFNSSSRWFASAGVFCLARKTH